MCVNVCCVYMCVCVCPHIERQTDRQRKLAYPPTQREISTPLSHLLLTQASRHKMNESIKHMKYGACDNNISNVSTQGCS